MTAILLTICLGAALSLTLLALALALILGLCRAAADVRTVDDGRAFGGDE